MNFQDEFTKLPSPFTQNVPIAYVDDRELQSKTKKTVRHRAFTRLRVVSMPHQITHEAQYPVGTASASMYEHSGGLLTYELKLML